MVARVAHAVRKAALRYLSVGIRFAGLESAHGSGVESCDMGHRDLLCGRNMPRPLPMVTRFLRNAADRPKVECL